jgi:cyclopropane fatty-acyl-phospholipid synthase-like methyltransferase
MNLAEIKESDRVLDAGCGVGGAAMFLYETRNVKVTGISLSQKQIDYANKFEQQKGIQNKVDFQLMDYSATSFPDESFDIIWACESVSSAQNKALFIKEAYRLLKIGGKLVLSDFFLTADNQSDRHEWIRKWKNTWGISNFVTSNSFATNLKHSGFINTQIIDYTSKIKRSARRMYRMSILGFLPSEFYNILHPNVSRFAKTHYKCGYYQQKALKENLWKYNIIVSVKN